jgi:hypothetical protein
MTILEAAEHLGVSKEAIHNRIRRGSLDVSVMDGVKYVEIDASQKITSVAPKTARARTTSKANEDRYYKFLEDQNAQLQTKVEKLEGETRTLRDQKEEMLIREREKIEQIYKEKDEQLKNFLNTLSAQFMLNAPQQNNHSRPQQQEEHLDAEIEEFSEENTQQQSKGELISLKKYLKKYNFSPKKQEKIKARFAKKANYDERIIVLGTKFYLDTIKFDYSDLIRQGKNDES